MYIKNYTVKLILRATIGNNYFLNIHTLSLLNSNNIFHKISLVNSPIIDSKIFQEITNVTAGFHYK